MFYAKFVHFLNRTSIHGTSEGRRLESAVADAVSHLRAIDLGERDARAHARGPVEDTWSDILQSLWDRLAAGPGVNETHSGAKYRPALHALLDMAEQAPDDFARGVTAGLLMILQPYSFLHGPFPAREQEYFASVRATLASASPDPLDELDTDRP